MSEGQLTVNCSIQTAWVARLQLASIKPVFIILFPLLQNLRYTIMILHKLHFPLVPCCKPDNAKLECILKEIAWELKSIPRLPNPTLSCRCCSRLWPSVDFAADINVSRKHTVSFPKAKMKTTCWYVRTSPHGVTTHSNSIDISKASDYLTSH